MKLYRYILFSTLFLLCNTASKGQGGFNPPNPPEPNTQYQLSLQTYPNGAGSVYGNGKYNPGTNVSVYTYNGTGFKFKSWKEGDVVISTSSSFSYKTEARNVTLTAHFEYDPGNPAEPQTPVIPKKSKLFLETKPNDAGSFNISSGNTYTEGTEVYVYAHNNTGFVFEGWQDGETVLTTNRNYYYTVTDKDKTLTAVYNYNPGNPSEPNTPQDIEHSLIGLTQIGGIGQTIAYPIYLLNHNIEVKSAKFDVIFPEGAIVDYQNAVLSDRNNGHYMTVTQAAGNKYQANITSVADQAFFESNGILLTIPVTLPDSWTPGQTYPVVIENILLGTPAGEISSTAKNGALGLKESEGQKIYASFQPDQFLNRVLFTNLSSDNVIKYEWDFGDGSTSEEKNPFHIYTSEGNYEVKLTVSNVNSSDTAKLNIRVNAESSWRMWGTFSLNENKTGVRNFTSLEEFFTLMSKSAINGDITLQVQAGKIFELPLASTKEMLTLVKNKLQQSGYNLTFVKDGSGSNPVISVTGTPTPENILFVRDLSASWILDQVELLIFGIKINLSAIKNFTGQTVCSGTATEKVDLPLISNELSYEWAVVNPPANVTGYTNSGTGKMPAMTLTNNTSRPETLKYQVLAKSGAIVFYELEYPFIVNPVLSGQVTNLSPNGNEELYQTAVDLSWSTVENAVYDIYIWETGTEIPTVPYAAGVQTFRYTCSGFCQYGKNYSWKVIARNACTNIESSVAQFKLRSLPNLHVTEINCSDAYGGKIMTVSWKVKNDGSGTTGASQWIDRVWLIPDIYTGTTNSATLLKSVDFVSALVPGQSYENSTEVTIPDRLSGNYYIAVVSDMYDLLSIDWTPAGNSVVNPYTPNVSGTPYPYLKATTNVYYKKVEEEGETANVSDNFFYKQIDIQIPPLPDLQVVSVVPQDNSLSGQTIKVDAMITNDGDDDTPVGKSWASSIYISKDAEFVEANAIRLAYNYNGGYLKVGENTTVSFNAAIPIDWYGTVYFYVFVDCFDQIYEHAKDNNNITRSNPVNVILTPPADLKPTAISIPSVISAGAAFDLSVDIINAGAGSPNNAYWTDIIYLSKTNAGINQNAIEIARNNRNETLKPGSSYRISKSVQLPNLDEGVYYVYAHTNTGNSVFELEKDNNILCSANTVTVVKPDLVVEWGNLPEVLTSGKIQNISWVVKNIGEGEVKEKSITDYIYLSKSVDGSNPVRLAEHTYDMLLAEGKEQTNYLNVTVPYNQLLHGTCYIFVRTDYRNILQEKLKYNNSVTHEITYNYVSLPDLKISGLSHADRIVPGTTLQVSYKLSNVGSAHITNENYPVEIFISAYPQFDNRAVKCEIASQIQPATGSGKLIAAGAYTDFIQEVSIPSSVKGGTMYVHVVANRDKSLAVINTEVQSVYKYIFVAGNLPALSITSRMAPANVQSSEPFEVTWNVINTGESASPAFEDAVYISSGSTLGSEHERLIVTGSVTLPVGQPTNRTATVAIPDKWYGQKYLIIAADANNRVQEADRSDNIVAIPIEVALSPLPDLQVTSIEAENNAISGQTFKIKYKVSNQGESITRQDKWTDEFYLSLGTALDKNRDYFLGKKLRVGTLEVGSHYIDSVEVTIPTEVSGNYNLMVYADAGNVGHSHDVGIAAERLRRRFPRSVAVPVNQRSALATSHEVRFSMSQAVQVFRRRRFDRCKVVRIGRSADHPAVPDTDPMSVPADDPVQSERELRPLVLFQKPECFAVPDRPQYRPIRTGNDPSAVVVIDPRKIIVAAERDFLAPFRTVPGNREGFVRIDGDHERSVVEVEPGRNADHRPVERLAFRHVPPGTAVRDADSGLTDQHDHVIDTRSGMQNRGLERSQRKRRHNRREFEIGFETLDNHVDIDRGQVFARNLVIGTERSHAVGNADLVGRQKSIARVNVVAPRVFERNARIGVAKQRQRQVVGRRQSIRLENHAQNFREGRRGRDLPGIVAQYEHAVVPERDPDDRVHVRRVRSGPAFRESLAGNDGPPLPGHQVHTIVITPGVEILFPTARLFLPAFSVARNQDRTADADRDEFGISGKDLVERRRSIRSGFEFPAVAVDTADDLSLHADPDIHPVPKHNAVQSGGIERTCGHRQERQFSINPRRAVDVTALAPDEETPPAVHDSLNICAGNHRRIAPRFPIPAQGILLRRIDGHEQVGTFRIGTASDTDHRDVGERLFLHSLEPFRMDSVGHAAFFTDDHDGTGIASRVVDNRIGNDVLEHRVRLDEPSL